MSLTKNFAKTLHKCTPVFLALGEPVRQQMIMVLVGVEEISVGDLTAELQLSRPAVSHHLKRLRLAGLVRIRRQGTVNFYALDIAPSVAMLKRLVADIELRT